MQRLTQARTDSFCRPDAQRRRRDEEGEVGWPGLCEIAVAIGASWVWPDDKGRLSE